MSLTRKVGEVEMNAVIRLDVPDWQIGQPVTVYFKDTMQKHGVCELLKEQEKKEIKLHKKHVITWKRDDEFTTKKLYEVVCETLMDEGELVIVRIDDHEKVDFTFYVTNGGDAK